MSTEKNMNTSNTTVTPAKHPPVAQAKEVSHTHTNTHPPLAKEVTHAHEAKAETKTAKKAEKTTSAKETKVEKTSAGNKPAKKKGTKAAWVKKEKVKKTDDVKENQDDLLGKWKPVFWGRFGKKNLRTRKNPKYDKWRKPRGEDMLLRKDDGMLVQSGYRTPKAIRFMHPSGYREVLIQSARDFNTMKPHEAARISGTVGRKKKIALIKIANEKKIQVLN